MKKLLYTIPMLIVFCCLLAISAFAIDADSLDDITTAIANATEGENAVINLTSDILVPNTASAIKIEKNMTLTINFNGYTLFTNSGSGGAGSVYGIKVNHGDAKLILNGTTTVDAMNYVVPNDEVITVSNGVINDPNEQTGVKSPDFASNGPAIMLNSGSIEMNNVYLRQYNGGEWGIYCGHSGNAEKLVTNMTLKNSILRVNDGSQFGALGTRGGNTRISESLCIFENSVIYGINGNRGEYWSFSKGSYVENCRFTSTVVRLDTYLNTNQAKGDYPVEFRNVIFEDKHFYINTGRMHANLIDCQFPNGMELSLGSDSGGTAKLIMTYTPTCTEDGKQAYTHANATMTSFEEFHTVVTDYTENNRKLGHNYIQGDVNGAYCPLGDWHFASCSRCDFNGTLNWNDMEATPTEHNHSILTGLMYNEGYSKSGVRVYSCSNDGCTSTNEISTEKPLIHFMGFAPKMDGTEMCIGYELDVKAMEQLKCFNKDLKYGIAVASELKVPSGRLLDINEQGSLVTASSYVINAEVQEYTYTKIDFKLKGDFASTYGDLSLLMSAYVYDGKEIKYICTNSDTDTVSAITYNQIYQ